MKIAFIIYDGMTTLDFAGVYDPLTRLRTMGLMDDLHYEVCAVKESVRSFEGLDLLPGRVGGSLAPYDLVVMPGGSGIMALVQDQAFLAWIKTARADAIMAAVCGGSIVWGFAGLLEGRRATTHPTLQGYLKHFARSVSGDRIVEDGRVITARGVTSALDLGLFLCEKIAGREVREKIQEQMDYPYYNPL